MGVDRSWCCVVCCCVGDCIPTEDCCIDCSYVSFVVKESLEFCVKLWWAGVQQGWLWKDGFLCRGCWWLCGIVCCCKVYDWDFAVFNIFGACFSVCGEALFGKV